MAQLMPLPLTVSCFSKIQIGFTFLVPAHPGSPGKRAVKRVGVCVCVYFLLGQTISFHMLFSRIPLSLYQTFASLRALCVSPNTKSVRRILVRGVSAPLPPEAKKILKFYYEMVHSEVYLDKYVVSIAPFSPPPIRKTALFLHVYTF